MNDGIGHMVHPPGQTPPSGQTPLGRHPLSQIWSMSRCYFLFPFEVTQKTPIMSTLEVSRKLDYVLLLSGLSGKASDL